MYLTYFLSIYYIYEGCDIFKEKHRRKGEQKVKHEEKTKPLKFYQELLEKEQDNEEEIEEPEFKETGIPDISCNTDHRRKTQ